MAAEWSSIRRDLLRFLGDLLSATNEAEMKAVCNNLRAAIAKPPPFRAGGDHRFLSRDWVMLEEQKPVDGLDGRLFVNVSTGRFLRLCVPLLDEEQYILVGATDGYLVLGDTKGLHPARLLNPFTGDLIPFAAPIPQESELLTAVAGSSSSPALLFWFEDCRGNDVVYCAEPTSPLRNETTRVVDGPSCQAISYHGRVEIAATAAMPYLILLPHTGTSTPETGFHHHQRRRTTAPSGFLATVVNQDETSTVWRIYCTAPRYCSELIAKTFDKIPFYYLVESARELLLVIRRHREDLVEVFKADTERKLLEPVRNIGSRALFLGFKCLSVNADKLPSVDSNCIYYAHCFGTDSFTKYDLSNSKVERFSCIFEDNEAIRPLSLVQTLLSYCDADGSDTCAQIQSLKD
uniref:KIB1-4 beta-propeller domain-containing protein n=1 Tax=Aegilops tauschii TaxID=37682 RepID=R7W3A9_AEGTA